MRNALYRILALLGTPALMRAFRGSSLTILLYHGVAPHADIGIYNYRRKFIDPLAFARQIEYLRRKYTILPLEEAVEKMKEGSLPPKALAVTFDDGYRNNYTYAFPVLRGQDIPATIYLTTGFVGDGAPLWVDRLEYAIGRSPEGASAPREEKTSADSLIRHKLKTLGRDEREKRLREIEESAGIALKDFADERAVYAPLSWQDAHMMRSYRIAFGAHTVSHPILSRLPITEQRMEIDDSRADVTEHLGSASSVFAYPNGQPGDYTEETIASLRHAGFSAAITTIPGVNTARTDPYQLRRISMDGTEDWNIFLLTTSGVIGWLSRLKKIFIRK